MVNRAKARGTAAETAVGVCGFGRSGTTAVMQLLHRMGVPAVDGSDPVSGELPDPAAITAALTRPDTLDGRSVKLLDHVLHAPIPPLPDWRFIWCDRNEREQARSTVKFLTLVGGWSPPGTFTRAEQDIRRTFGPDRPKVLDRLSRLGPVLRIRYEDLIATPGPVTRRIAEHCGDDAGPLPGWADAAAAVIHPRRPGCAPGLVYELTGEPDPRWSLPAGTLR